MANGTPKLPSLSIFFPMHNEEGNVEEAVRRALEVAPKVAERFEILVVNDGSTDATPALAGELAREHPEVRVVTHEHNKGYGAALISGIRSSRFDYIFYTDGDNQFELAELMKLTPLIDDAAIVTGFRAKRNDPWSRKLNAALFNLAVTLAFGLRLKDIDCAFKLFRSSVFDGMLLTTQGAMIDTEILARAKRKGAAIKEVPVSHFPRKAGQQSGADPHVILRAMREFAVLWLRMKLNR